MAAVLLQPVAAGSLYSQLVSDYEVMIRQKPGDGWDGDLWAFAVWARENLRGFDPHQPKLGFLPRLCCRRHPAISDLPKSTIKVVTARFGNMSTFAGLSAKPYPLIQGKRTSHGKGTTGRLRVTVKSAGRLKLSSKLWLERQLNDPYVAQAKRDGLRSRAAYKLIEMDDKYHFLKKGTYVVDLGAAPGGWSQIAARRVGAADGKGKVIAIDLLEMPEISGVTFAQLDFLLTTRRQNCWP